MKCTLALLEVSTEYSIVYKMYNKNYGIFKSMAGGLYVIPDKKRKCKI